MQKELINLPQKGGFNLCKWRNNDKRILNALIQNKKEDELLILSKHEVLRTLGLLWNSEQDYLSYEIKIIGDQAVTKREILSLTSQIFDPLGLIGPI